MKVAGLLSGGINSVYSLGRAIAHGHQPLCVASLYGGHSSSLLFRNIDRTLLSAIASSIELPHVSRKVLGMSLCKDLIYKKTENDEVEDLYELLLELKYKYPQVKGIVSGLILSDYKRLRIEDACSRLGLVSICPLWRANKRGLLKKMVEEGYQGLVTRVYDWNDIKEYDGKSTGELWNFLESHKEIEKDINYGLKKTYETFALDAPIMKKKIEIKKISIGDSSIQQFIVKHKQTNKAEILKDDEPTTFPQFFQRGKSFYTGEISAESLNTTPENLDDEIFTVLKGLKEMLHAHNFSMQDIFYVNVYMKDMRDFERFNSVYAMFFNFPNPPARIFCEYATQKQNLKIAVKGYKGPKICTWVRSITPWSVANIGPYSQAFDVKGILHMAGVIPLVPTTMEMSHDQVSTALRNSEAIAGENGFKLTNSDLCLVYYSDYKPMINPELNPFYIKPTKIPKNSDIEFEFHLRDTGTMLENSEVTIEGEGYHARIQKRESTVKLYLIWYAQIENDTNPLNLIQKLKKDIEDYVKKIKRTDKVEDLEKYVNDVRVYSPDAEKYKQDWFLNVPAVFIDTETRGIVISVQDFNN
ncbi:unnamed protein product [Blepharisma stoltei]|uniref:Diphthine--ammonia ligase n=1 Tax=Blepharisma stoltei TaxID=1481888 RepID=A0AAU9I8J3_9CILI|nr:unnamed protein product [Blepharisma stoltei]